MATGTPAEAHVPVRTCVGCRNRFAKTRVLRLAQVAGRIVADPPARRPGRGCYVCDRVACLDRALEQDGRRVRRSLRQAAGCATVDETAIRAAWQQAHGGLTPPRRTDGDGRQAGDPGQEHHRAEARRA